MIVPLPTWLLDILLAANISLCIGVLLVVLYIPNALAIATFPTLLLITTLLRLSLNVSSTRLILLQGNAGEVIRAFGNFVVRGNYVVGAVVFLVLTIIQFVVIAKGSERVAEVGARFALDAMPGKQMAIDAEMRAGSFDGQEAKRRRVQLTRESQFYGAMDGAMNEQHAAKLRPAQRGAKGPSFMPVVTPWSVYIDPGLQSLIDDERKGDEVVRTGLRSLITDLRERMFAELGAPLPPSMVRVSDQLPANRVDLSIFGVPYRDFDVDANADTETRLASIDTFLFASLRSRAADFIGITETQMLLDQLEQVSPTLARHVVPKPFSLSLLSDILRRLVEEGISVRDLRCVLEALAQAPPTEKDPLSLTELVRGHMRRATTFQLTSGASSLAVYLVDPEVEDTVRSAVQRTPSGSFLALAPQTAREILAAIRSMANATPPPEGCATVLLTQPDVRRFIRKLVETEFPDMKVVSYAELMPGISLRPLGRATIARR
jgi:type III secretory pathway component EscV